MKGRREEQAEYARPRAKKAQPPTVNRDSQRSAPERGAEGRSGVAKGPRGRGCRRGKKNPTTHV